MSRPNYLPSRSDFKALLRLAVPIVVIQLGLIAMGVVDTIMVGHVSPTALAAVALGNLYSFGFCIFGLGVLLALDPIIAQALGAGDEPAVRRGLQRGLVLSLVLTVPTSLMLLAAEPALTLLQQPAEVIPFASGYVFRVLPSIWPFFAFVVLRQTLQAHHRTQPILLALIAANLINAGLNYLLIFGNLGFPELGVLGSAWATTVSRWFLAALMLALGWRYLGPYLTRLAPDVFSPAPIIRMLKVGAPIGVQMLLEFGAFASIALLMGWLGVVQVAAHQVAINLASQSFMVAVGISSAGAVAVGHAVGRGDSEGVHRASLAALMLGTGFMSATALTFVTVPGVLARVYTDELEVLSLAVLLIPIAGVFQVFDGIQAVSLGLLRGLGDTRVPMMVSIVGFWCLGMPVSLWLAFGLDRGAVGLWWGLVVGLTIVSIVLVVRIRYRQGRELERLIIDEHGPATEPASPD